MTHAIIDGACNGWPHTPSRPADNIRKTAVFLLVCSPINLHRQYKCMYHAVLNTLYRRRASTSSPSQLRYFVNICVRLTAARSVRHAAPHHSKRFVCNVQCILRSHWREPHICNVLAAAAVVLSLQGQAYMRTHTRAQRVCMRSRTCARARSGLVGQRARALAETPKWFIRFNRTRRNDVTT